jgi:putative NADH-flavin reductase
VERSGIVSRIIVFGAGGRAGRRVVAEAVSRGHQVTAVVRDPAQHQDLSTAGLSVAAGDVTAVDDVADLAAGHDVAVNAAARLDVPSEQFFPAAARALVEGLVRAGVGRLLAIGVGTTLETAPGVAVHDAPDFPAAYRAFSLGHAAQLEVLRAADPGLDWVVLVPPPTVLDNEAIRTGRYRIGGTQVLAVGDGTPMFSYADLAVALVDEVESPKHHRELVAIAP